MVSKTLLSAGLLGLSSGLILSGCNMANSGDSSAAPTNLAQPTADLSVASVSRSATTEGYYYENTTLNVEASSVGSQGSTVSCVVTFDYKASPTADFVTKETFNSCQDYDFNLYNGPGTYRIKLTSTDANSLVAEDQIFATAITDPNFDIYLQTNPRATISIISASTSPDSNGYYFENTTLVTDIEAIGSQRSDVTCVITLAHKGTGATEFTTIDTVNDCETTSLNLSNGVGTYQAKLVVTDGNSKVAEDQKYVIAIPEVLANTVYLNAEFAFTVSTDPDSLYDVFLDARTSSEGTGGDIAKYTWEVFLKQEDEETELTDQRVVEVQSPTTTVTVNQDGIYVAKLTIEDAAENKAITEKMFKVGGTGDQLIADFSVTVPSASPVNIQVDASSSTIGGTVEHYEWEVMQNSTTSVEYQIQTHSPTTVLPITTAGDYLIRLTVIDTSGNEYQITRIVSVS